MLSIRSSQDKCRAGGIGLTVGGRAGAGLEFFLIDRVVRLGGADAAPLAFYGKSLHRKLISVTTKSGELMVSSLFSLSVAALSQ